jgi:hypothetical protein
VAYTPDFSLRSGARVEPVFVGHMDEGFEPDMVRGLENKVDELAREGVRSRMLVRITLPLLGWQVSQLQSAAGQKKWA